MGARIGLQGYVRILAAIKRTPLDGLELSRRFEVQSTAMNKLLRAMRALDMVHIADWTPLGNKHVVRRPMYLMGPGEDAPNPETKTGTPTRHLGAVDVVAMRHRVNLIALKALMHAMSGMARSNSQLAALTGMHEERQRDLVELMHELKLVRIEDWRRSRRGPSCPLYRLGDGYNKSRPEPIPASHYTRLRTLKRRSERLGQAASKVSRARVAQLFPGVAPTNDRKVA